MNAALFSGTIGYFLRTLIREAVSEATLERIRDFFIRFVRGRGPLTAVKVGRQPYGIVLASTCLTREETMARGEQTGFIGGIEHSSRPCARSGAASSAPFPASAAPTMRAPS